MPGWKRGRRKRRGEKCEFEVVLFLFCCGFSLSQQLQLKLYIVIVIIIAIIPCGREREKFASDKDQAKLFGAGRGSKIKMLRGGKILLSWLSYLLACLTGQDNYC